jgi:hypothetical protein
MTIMQRIENDPTIGFTVSGRPFPEPPRPYWNGIRRVVFRDQDNAFRYCQQLNEQNGAVYSVLATDIREIDDIAD